MINLKQEYVNLLNKKTKKGFWGLMTLGQKSSSKTFNWYAKKPQQLYKYLSKYRDCYLTQNTTKSFNRKDNNIAQFIQAYVDLDVENLAHLKMNKRSPLKTFNVNKFISDLNLDLPTAIMFSGHGLYFKWIFKDTAVNNDKTQHLHYVYVNALKGLAEYINDKARLVYHKSRDWAIADEKSTNALRLLRIGNTYNHKGSLVKARYLSVKPQYTIDFHQFLTAYYGYHKCRQAKDICAAIKRYKHLCMKHTHHFARRTLWNSMVNTMKMRLRGINAHRRHVDEAQYQKWQKEAHTHKNSLKFNQLCFCDWCLQDLWILAKIRKGTGFRDILLYEFASLLEKLDPGLSTKMFEISLQRINQCLQQPCDSTEIIHLMRQRKAKTLRHRLTRNFIMKALFVTPTEQKFLHTLRKSHNSKRISLETEKKVTGNKAENINLKARRKQMRALRDKAILALHAEHRSSREIQKMTNNSRGTILNTIHSYKAQNWNMSVVKNYWGVYTYKQLIKDNVQVWKFRKQVSKYETKRCQVRTKRLADVRANTKDEKYWHKMDKQGKLTPMEKMIFGSYRNMHTALFKMHQYANGIQQTFTMDRHQARLERIIKQSQIRNKHKDNQQKKSGLQATIIKYRKMCRNLGKSKSSEYF